MYFPFITMQFHSVDGTSLQGGCSFIWDRVMFPTPPCLAGCGTHTVCCASSWDWALEALSTSKFLGLPAGRRWVSGSRSGCGPIADLPDNPYLERPILKAGGGWGAHRCMNCPIFISVLALTLLMQNLWCMWEVKKQM